MIDIVPLNGDVRTDRFQIDLRNRYVESLDAANLVDGFGDINNEGCDRALSTSSVSLRIFMLEPPKQALNKVARQITWHA